MNFDKVIKVRCDCEAKTKFTVPMEMKDELTQCAACDPEGHAKLAEAKAEVEKMDTTAKAQRDPNAFPDAVSLDGGGIVGAVNLPDGEGEVVDTGPEVGALRNGQPADAKIPVISAEQAKKQAAGAKKPAARKGTKGKTTKK